METWEWIVIAGAAALVLVLGVTWLRIRRRRAHLKERFGPEYQRAVGDAGTAGAEKRLVAIEAERDGLELRQLPRATRDRYLEEWRQAESRFVSDPRDAVRAAERLVVSALEERGYPDTADDDERLAVLVSADNPHVGERYRHGHAMLDEVDGAESTEHLRKAMLDFRAVLEDVVQTGEPAAR